MRAAREMTLFLAVVMAAAAAAYVTSEQGVAAAISHVCKILPLLVRTNKSCSVNTPAAQHP